MNRGQLGFFRNWENDRRYILPNYDGCDSDCDSPISIISLIVFAFFPFSRKFCNFVKVTNICIIFLCVPLHFNLLILVLVVGVALVDKARLQFMVYIKYIKEYKIQYY